MAYDFGGAVGSRCRFTIDAAIGASSAAIVTGWYLPTTLTATRRYWGVGTATGARIATTTSEIEMLTDNATTDGVWLTSGAGIVTNVWQFIAWIGVMTNTGPAAAWRVYVGTVDRAPTEVSVTNPTAPVGNISGSSTFVFGNTSSSNVSIQGSIGDCSLVRTADTSGTTSYGLTSFSAISQAEADAIYYSHILPHWLGDPGRAIDGRGGAFSYYYWSALPLSYIDRRSTTAVTVNPTAPTMTSAVVSANANPRPSRYPVLATPPVRR